MTFPFTHEQLPAINSLARLVRLIAFAGTGKTTTLVGYAAARPQLRILYLCFNKSVEVEAKKRFGPHVVCKTSHGLAYAAFGAKYKHKLATNIRLTDVARIISSQNWDLVRSVLDTLNAFLASADQDIDLCHVPVERLRTERMKRAAGNIVTSARLLWARMCDINDTEARIDRKSVV